VRTNAGSWLVALGYVGLGAACVVALYATGGYYRYFAIRQMAVHAIHELELAFVVWYGLWGSLATLAFAAALLRTGVAERALWLVGRLSVRPWLLVAGAGVVAAAWATALHHVVLLGEPVADDELVYAFQAQTLLRGRLVNPVPDDAAFFRNQFVHVDARGWYGKYPIGHPLALAVGELLGARWLVGPVLALVSVLLTFALGRRLFGARRAALGAALLCLSPQFVGTHATALSQTTSACATLLGAWALVRLRDDGRLRWAACAGAAWGFALLVRPLPGALFLVVACASWWWDDRGGAFVRGSRISQLAVGAPGVLVALVLVLWTNHAETGSPLESAYDVERSRFGLIVPSVAKAAASFGGALIRQNLWLFGWTLSLAFVAFARPTRARGLFWGLIAAEYAYRLILPKTVVASTGPIYVFEIVPLLALATADGAARAGHALERFAVPRARALVAAAMIAASLVACAVFVPLQTAALHTGAVMRSRVRVALARAGADRALVFANRLVEPPWGATWAYHAPNPSPTLDDDVLFVRLPLVAGGPWQAYEFWRRRFPERRAFVFVDAPRKILFEEMRVERPPSRTAWFPEVVRDQGGWPAAMVDPRSTPRVSQDRK
jgi:hypothetical protein